VPANGPSEAAAGWVLGLAPLLLADDPKLRALGQRELRDGLERASLGPVAGPEDLEEALRAQIDDGFLSRSPEARLELGRHFARRGDRDHATRVLAAAARTAADLADSDEPEARERARSVNTEASKIFYELGDMANGAARYAVGRYYSTPASRRFRGDLIPYVQGNAANTRPGPSMHAPYEQVPVPNRLKVHGRDGDPPLPPKMEGRPVMSMQGLDAINALGAWVGACRDLCALASFLERCRRADVGRNYLRAPLRPSEVRDLERTVDEDLHGPSPERRAVARRILATVDFGLLEECSRAYWGTRR
jgi:hypothetical protein